MTIPIELEGQILRYFHVEKWKIGTIAKQLVVHHSVVRRVLAQTGIPKTRLLSQTSLIVPYLSFITETLSKYPRLTAMRLYNMVCERGYAGGPDHFRHLIALHRPRPMAEAYLRLRTLPGEQAQVDWGHFGYITIGKAKRPLMAFVMTLSYSRKIFLRFYLNAQMANFLRGHEAAFQSWNGLPKILLYDNLRSAVLERLGDAIRFNPTLLAFAAHYRFEPRPVAIARGNEKGRVERSIRYIRDNFFAAREWKNLDDLNIQAELWCETQATNRPCPENKELTVKSVFESEKSKLMSLPDNPFVTDELVEVKVGKTPYARFDLNDYSIPYKYVRRTLTVLAQSNKISILDGTTVIAEHVRSYDRSQQIEQETHIKELVEYKSQARGHRGQNRLVHAVPISATFLEHAAERGYHLSSMITHLILLLERYGPSELEMAMQKAQEQGVPHPNSVRMYLIQSREERQQLPPIAIELPNDSRVRNLVVRPHKLKDYEQLQSTMEESQDDN